MRQFSKPMRIERLSLEARILYTAFCLFLLLGAGTSVWFYLDDELGIAPSSAAAYYLGGPGAEASAPREQEPSDGPDLELPELAPSGPDLEGLPDLDGAPSDVDTAPMKFEKSARQVMETFHFHLFSVPVCLLIVGHIFMMCGLATRTKVLVLLLASASTLVHILAPPLIRFGGDAFAVLMFPSALIMGITWCVLLAWPIWEMWRPHPDG